MDTRVSKFHYLPDENQFCWHLYLPPSEESPKQIGPLYVGEQKYMTPRLQTTNVECCTKKRARGTPRLRLALSMTIHLYRDLVQNTHEIRRIQGQTVSVVTRILKRRR